MKETIDVIRRHRSVRTYEEEPIPDEHIEDAIRAGQKASTSSNIQAYCLIRIRDEATRAKLVELTGNQPKVAQCGAFFVICGDSRRHRIACKWHGLEYDARFEAFLLATVDASLFAQNLVLAFESMGYGICYIGGLRSNLPMTSAVLEIPYGVYPLFGLCVGIPSESPLPHARPRPRLPLEAVLFEDRYPDDDTLHSVLDAYDTDMRQYDQNRGEACTTWSARMTEKFSRPRRIDVGPYYQSQESDLSRPRNVPRPDFRGNRLRERAVQQVGKSVLDSAVSSRETGEIAAFARN